MKVNSLKMIMIMLAVVMLHIGVNESRLDVVMIDDFELDVLKITNGEVVIVAELNIKMLALVSFEKSLLEEVLVLFSCPNVLALDAEGDGASRFEIDMKASFAVDFYWWRFSGDNSAAGNNSVIIEV